MDKLLYRGVNVEKDENNAGELKPIAYKKVFKRKPYYSGGHYYGDGTVFGESERNAIVQHQKDSEKYQTSGISTTPNYANAVEYAKGREGTKEGYLYTIDVSLLEEYGVTAHIVDEHVTKPIKPEDHEVILVADDFGSIPNGVVVNKVRVT